MFMGAEPDPEKATHQIKVHLAGTDGGWVHVKPLKCRHVTPTSIVSSDFDSAWHVYDKQILNPKEWGKTNELWRTGLRDWPASDAGTRRMPTERWKGTNYKRWPLRRQPRFNRSGVEVCL